ncbi:C-type lectin domain family 4 member K-like [Rhea pennata]|uniref:C-type lectin domain family 4 member K-like n=1 Tax=Rhea pennata TaxID=8795 RepID=UPI002E259113
MAAQGADLYESLKIKYPRSFSQDARAERELRAERAAAANASHEPPRGCAAPGGAASCRERLGRWLQRLSIGWRYHDGNIYYFSDERKPWQDAEDFCVSKQSHLTSITSAEEQDYLAREAGKRFYWIGLTDRVKEGTWRWVDGTEYKPGVSFWAPGQPDNRDYGQNGREECAQIHPVGNSLWNDHNCNVSFLWICKRHFDAAGL